MIWYKKSCGNIQLFKKAASMSQTDRQTL